MAKPTYISGLERFDYAFPKAKLYIKGRLTWITMLSALFIIISANYNPSLILESHGYYMKKLLPLLAGIIANVIFGTTLYAIILATNASEGNSLQLLSYRFVIGTIILTIPLILGITKLSFKGKPVALVLLLATSNPVLSFLTEAWALNIVPSSQFGVFSSLTPIVTVILSVILIKEKPTIKQLLFMLLSVVGVLIINSSGTIGTIGIIGILLIIANMVANSIYRIFIGRLATGFTIYELTYLVTIYGAVIFTAMSLWEHITSGNVIDYFDMVTRMDFMAPVLFLTIGSTVIAMALINYSLSNLPITVSAALGNIIPTVAIFMGVFFLNEPFTTSDIIGSAIILFSVFGISLSYGTSANKSASKQD